MVQVRTTIVILLFASLVVGALLSLPSPYALMVGIALIVAFILLDARGNRILFIMGARNILRRKGTTVLVLCGLMVGTAIISASFVVGNTLDNMIIGDTTRGSGGADFVIEAPTEQGTRILNLSLIDGLVGELRAGENVRTVQPFLESSVGVLDNETQLTNAGASVMGVTIDLLSSYELLDAFGERIIEVPQSGRVYINEKMATELDADVGHHLVLFKGNASLNLVVQEIVRYEQLGSFRLEPHVFLDLTAAQELMASPDKMNIVFVSLEDHSGSTVDRARQDINATLQAYQGEGLRITEDKQRSIDEGLDDMATYTSLFFMLGSFSVIAGIALIVNIFTMLGEERKSEMGISRSVGMKRSQLIRVFTYEGMIYAALAAGLGSIAGLALAYFLINMAARVIDLGDLPLVRYFDFTTFSLALSYLIGFLITLLVVYLTTRRISSLNIVRAVRGIPEPPLSRNDRRSRLTGLVLSLGGATLIVVGVLTESQLFSMGGLSCVTMSLGFLLRAVLGDRVAWNIAGAATLFIWLPLPFAIFPYSGFIELFIIAGIFMVIAALVLVMFNSDQIIWFFTRLLRARKRYRAVIRTAISYPLKSKFRTALTVFIFGLVIFTITTLSVISGILDVGIPKMAEETSGGYDIIATTNPLTPLEDDLWEYSNTSSSFIEGGNMTSVVSLQAGRGLMRTTTLDSLGNAISNQTTYNVMGFDSRLYKEGSYWMADWDRTMFASEEEVWQAVLEDTGLVIVDGSMLTNEMSDLLGGPRTEVGGEITLTTTTGTYSFKVVGIMKQPVLTGMFVSHEFTSSG